MKHRSIALFSVVSALSSCTSTGVGNPFRETSFEFVASESPEPAAVDPEAGLAEGALDHALVVIAQLALAPCDESLANVVVGGPFVVDLVSGDGAPELSPVPTPEGGFCALEAPLTPARRPAAIAGRSIFLSGQRSDGVPFLIYAAAELTLRVEARAGEAWGEADGDALLWAFRPRRWLEQSEVDSAEINAQDGGLDVVIVDSNRHPLLYSAILTRIGGRSGMYRDLNKNRRVDLSELENAWVGIGLGTTE
jgi:hypothetical protein